MKIAKKTLSVVMAVLMVLSCWVWVAPKETVVAEAAEAAKDHYLFAYFTGTSKEGQTIHLAVSKDGYNYDTLRANEPVIVPSKGVGNVRDPYIWYNEQDNYYYILATDLDFTDTGSDYSNNSQSFIIWRSKDLIHWYDETMIDVSKMAHLIGDTRNMSAVWAPQVLWDGSAYVVYFTLACNATSWFDIVYLKTTDLMNPDAYYEFDYILGNSTGNGVDNGYGVIDADIIHNPGDGKYYLFYKTECNGHEMGSTATGTSLKTIHYYVGDTPTGPFRNPGDTKWSNAGFSIFPNYNVSLEGCNSFWDNDGNLIMYVDEFEHTNYYTGKPEAYFHIAKSNGNDFTSWSYPDVSKHNINSLSPRHGSVVKITEEEYKRLRMNSYLISSSSFPETEVLEDHLVAQYFTTGDVHWNNVVGQPNLATSTGITMVNDASIGYYAQFDSTNGGWAEVDFDSLFLKTDGLNYDDGFTITFNAMLQPNAAVNNENNDRIYEIADIFGSRTGTEHYTHFSPGGGGNGSYIGNYNGPVDSGNDWLDDKDRANRDDEKFHEYIISYANGNVMCYVDGQLVISRNRFTGVKLDESWYEALGSNATMRIGRSGWDADPLFKGRIQNLCIYDCSMSYYDIKNMTDAYKEQLGSTTAKIYNGITSVVPTFSASNASQMEPLRGTNFSNVLYSQPLTGTPSGTTEKANPTHSDYINSAATYHSSNNVHFGIYYSKLTVLLIDGINDALIPVEVAGRINHKDREAYLSSVYPSNGGSESDNPIFKLTAEWVGWNSNTNYHDTIKNPDGTSHQIGHNQATSTSSAWLDDQNSQSRKIQYYASTIKVDEANVDFGNSYYKKFDLIWRMKGHVDNPGSFSVPLATKNNPIYLIDFRPVIQLRAEITDKMYNEVMNNSALCPALREKYAAAVYGIRTLDPYNYNFDVAPETATKALATAIREAVNTYKGVMAEIEREKAAGSYGHQCSEFAAREATCTKNGLTAGSYCAICGEIEKEQEVLAPLPHTFGDIFTENGIQYRKCSVCGVKIEYQPSSVRYENLFSLNRWSKSKSTSVGNGSSYTDLINGTIKINNNHTSEVFTYAYWNGTNLTETRDFDCYCIPVKGGQTYVVEATSLASSTSGGEVFVFQYNKDGLVYSAIPTVLGLAPGQTAHNEFTVDKNAAYIELRFDCNDAGKTITYSQIGVYTKDSADKFIKDTADARLGFYPGDSKKLCVPNPNDGYSWAGWYTSNGVKIENVNQLNNPTTIVYGLWIPAGFDLTYDSIFSFSNWAKSSCNQLYYKDDNSTGTLQRLVKQEGIITDAENGTITLYNDEDTNNFARTNYWVDNGNIYKSPLKPNTEYILEYTVTSDDGGKPSVCLYITGGTAQYPETGNATRYSTGTHYFRFDSGNNTNLTLRFDNVQHGSTVTFSDIAVYEASFEEAARTITNREYRRYYPKSLGFGNIFEYTPVRPGFTFDTWMADTHNAETGLSSDQTNFTPDGIGDYDCKNLADTALIKQNWHVYSTWTENSYNIAYNANNGSGSVSNQTGIKYTADVALAASGFTRAGYRLAGWSTVANATTPLYQLGQTTSRLNGDNNGTITLYAVWVREVAVNITFDNLIDFKSWNKTAGNGTVSNETDTGFTITSNAGVGEATSSSPYFPVEPGKQYKIEMDFTGNNWDVYIFFCDKNGTWIDFKDGPTNRYSSNGSTGIDKDNAVFTAPNKSEVVKAQIRVDANNANNTVRFENIRVYEINTVAANVSYIAPVTIYNNTAYGNLPVPTRDGFDFIGWYNGSTKIEATTILSSEQTVNLVSRWKINNNALTSDIIVVDFDSEMSLAPADNDTALLKGMGKTGKYTIGLSSTENGNAANTVNGNYGMFTINNGNITYTPTKAMFTTDSIFYKVDFTEFGTTSTAVSKITVAPASNIMFGENRFNVTNTTSVDWTKETDTTTESQVETDVIYGYDKAYDNTDNYSDGTYFRAELTETAKRSENMSFTFSGTGFQLYGDCGADTGVLIVSLKNNDTNKMVKSYIVDTFYNDTFGTLHQTPIITEMGLDYGSYTVQIVASYVSFAGALNTPVATFGLRGGFGVPSVSPAEMFYEHLVEIGMDDIYEADDLEFILFDEESMFNSAFGAVTYALGDESDTGNETETRQASGLINIIDGIRVFNPLNEDYSFYVESEQGVQYYNVMDNLVSGGMVSGSGNFAYVVGNENWEIKEAEYDSIGSKDEIYLTNNTHAITFTIGEFNKDTQRVMISLRAASGTPKAKIGASSDDIISSTEMYYDITEYVNEDGTVTIQNDGTGLLAIGNVKVTGTPAPMMMSTFNMRSARMMMMAPANDVDFNEPPAEPELPEIPEEPSTDPIVPEEPSTDADNGDSEQTEKSFFDKIYDLIDFIVYLIKKLFSTINFMQNL